MNQDDIIVLPINPDSDSDIEEIVSSQNLEEGIYIPIDQIKVDITNL